MGFGNSQMHFLRFFKTKENYKENLSKKSFEKILLKIKRSLSMLTISAMLRLGLSDQLRPFLNTVRIQGVR